MCVDFVLLCDALCSVGMLTVPVANDVFIFQTDASGVELRVVEMWYSVTELECLPVVETVKHFEIYLHGKQFRVETEHLCFSRISE